MNSRACAVNFYVRKNIRSKATMELVMKEGLRDWTEGRGENTNFRYRSQELWKAPAGRTVCSRAKLSLSKGSG